MKGYTLFGITILSVLMFSTVAFSQCFRTFRGHPVCRPKPVIRNVAPVIKKEVIIEEVPIAVPVFVPAFQFQYQAPICVPNNQYGYNYGHMPNNRGFNYQGFSQDQIRELARALLEEINRQSQFGSEDGPPVAVDPYGNRPPPQPVTNPGERQIRFIAVNGMIRTCAYCHTGIGSKGDTVLFTQPGVLSQTLPWNTIKRMVASKQMPPKQSQFKLTDAEIKAIIALADLEISK